MEPDFAKNGLLGYLAPTSSTRTVFGAETGDEDAGSKSFVDALTEESTGAVALVRDGDRDEEDKDEGGKETVKVDVCAHEGIQSVVGSISIMITVAVVVVVVWLACWTRARGRGHDVESEHYAAGVNTTTTTI